MQYLATDRASSVTDATTSTGGTSGIARALRYDPFGYTIAANTSPVTTTTCTSGSAISDARYHSTRQDATTGDYQFGSRTYDPTKSTFTTSRNGPSNADLSVNTDTHRQHIHLGQRRPRQPHGSRWTPAMRGRLCRQGLLLWHYRDNRTCLSEP